MRGPLPTGTARRRNRPEYAGTVVPSEGRRGDAPKPPAWVILGDRGRAWWAWAWATPQAVTWNAGDLGIVARRAVMEDLLEVLDPLKVMAQMLAVDDRLGLSPKALKQMRIAVAADEVAEAREDRPVLTAVPPAKKRVKAVDKVAS